MKCSSSSFSVISVAALLALPSSFAAATERGELFMRTSDDEASTPVHIAVTCVGADLSTLTLPKGSVVGVLLEDTYNRVVALDDADDSELGDVTYSGNRITKGSTKTGLWKGTWGCELCTKDDAAETKVWELELVAGLLASGDEAFRKIKTCSIVMTVGTSPANNDTPPPNAKIQVDCGKSVKMSALGVAKGTFLAHAVQRSYMKVHGNIADDDSALDHVMYQESSKALLFREKLTRKPRPANLNGLWWICRMCPKGDDDLMDGVQVRGATLMAWQAELVAMLQQSNFPAFRKITKCQIKLLPHVVSGGAIEME